MIKVILIAAIVISVTSMAINIFTIINIIRTHKEIEQRTFELERIRAQMMNTKGGDYHG